MKAEDYALNGLRKLAINKNYIGAIEDFTEAIRLATDYAEAYYHRGLAKFNLARYSKREDNNPLQNLNDRLHFLITLSGVFETLSLISNSCIIGLCSKSTRQHFAYLWCFPLILSVEPGSI